MGDMFVNSQDKRKQLCYNLCKKDWQIEYGHILQDIFDDIYYYVADNKMLKILNVNGVEDAFIEHVWNFSKHKNVDNKKLSESTYVNYVVFEEYFGNDVRNIMIKDVVEKFDSMYSEKIHDLYDIICSRVDFISPELYCNRSLYDFQEFCKDWSSGMKHIRDKMIRVIKRNKKHYDDIHSHN